MSHKYFSDREQGSKPRIQEEITADVWGGIIVAIRKRVLDGSFGYTFPLACYDESNVAVGCDENSFALALKSEVVGVQWPFKSEIVPSNYQILDLIEFCYRSVGQPIQGRYHPYFDHYHLTFNLEAGQSEFRNAINTIFARNGLVYELNNDGYIIRLTSEIAEASLLNAAFRTGDEKLDTLLNTARSKFISTNLETRKESLEKLWDAWERLKNIEHIDKKQSIGILLDKTSPEPKFRVKLEEEARILTEIGNNFNIRHSEITQTPLEFSEQVDYLFYRLFALIYYLLARTNRISQNKIDDEDLDFIF